MSYTCTETASLSLYEVVGLTKTQLRLQDEGDVSAALPLLLTSALLQTKGPTSVFEIKKVTRHF